MNFLLYITIFFSTMGSNALGISFLGVNLSPYRIFIIISFVWFIIKNHGVINLSAILSKFPCKVLTILFLYALITLLWAKDKTTGIKTLFFILIAVFLLIMLVNEFSETDKIVNACKSFSFGTAIQSLIGLSEIMTGVYRFVPQGSNYLESYKRLRLPVAMWYNVNDFATVLSFGVLASLIVFFTTNKKWEKILFAGISILSIIVIFLSGSRANMIGMVIMASIIIVIYKKTKWLIVPALLACLIYSSKIYNTVFNLLELGNSAVRSSDAGRLRMILDGLKYLWKTAGFGVGTGQVSVWSVAERGVEGGAIHNWFIEVLVSYGLVFFIIYIISYLKMIKINYMGLKSDHILVRNISICVFSFLIAFILISVSCSSLSDNEAMWTIYDIILLWYVFISSRNEKLLSPYATIC